jgi:hypothetical protein
MRPEHVANCRLCGDKSVLQNSHFLPAAMYRHLNPGDNKHVIINERTYFSTSRQVTARLLCRKCEQRFSSNGEQWVMENGFRGQGRFQLQDVLKASPSLGRTRTGRYFSGSDLPDVDVDRLSYFGASVFWRASIHRWPDQGGIDLGSVYTEQFRRFLLGEDSFPKNAALVIHVSDAEKPMEGAYFPTGGRVTGAAYYRYTFMMPGMLFTLAVGGGLPEQLRQMCAVQSSGRLIFLSSRVQDLLESIAIDMMAENKTVQREVREGVRPRKV